MTVEEVMQADFHTFEHYTDTDECLDFEGSEHVHQDYFTDEEWLLTREFQRIFLTELFTDDARALMSARTMRKPLILMQQKVDTLLGNQRV